MHRRTPRRPWRRLVIGATAALSALPVALVAAPTASALPYGFRDDLVATRLGLANQLTALLDGGYFDRVAGVLLGEWTGCSPGPDGITVDEVLFERLSRLGIPVLAHAPMGHGDENTPVVLGSRWRLDGARGRAEQVAGAAWFG